MTTINFPWFRLIVVDQVASELVQYGYQLLVTNEEGESEYAAVEFRKEFLPDVYCTIGFQLLKHYIHPKREFQVILDRRQLLLGDQSKTDYAYSLVSAKRWAEKGGEWVQNMVS